MWTGRAVTFVFMLAAAAWAPQIDKFPTLWQYLQSALSYIVPPIVALFIIGVFWKRANANGAVAGIVIGIVSAAFFLGFSGFTWQQKIYERETIEISKLPFMWNYRYLSALLIASLMLILLLFW